MLMVLGWRSRWTTHLVPDISGLTKLGLKLGVGHDEDRIGCDHD